MSNPDRLYIDAKVRSTIDELEKLNILNVKEAKNKEIFLYAMAVGLEAPTHIDGKKDGYLLDKDLNSTDEALIFASIIPHVENIDDIVNKSMVYDFAQRYANTGFKIMNSYINDTSIENLDKNLLAELEDRYDELIKE